MIITPPPRRGARRLLVAALSGALLSSLVAVAACDEGFVTATYSEIAVEPDAVYFASLERGESSTDELVKILQAGERPLVVKRVYLATEGAGGELSEVEGCDRVTEGVDPSLPLQPTVLEGCDFVISERPAAFPVTVAPGGFEQVVVTYRPLMSAPPTGMLLVVESDAFESYVKTIPLAVSESRPELGGLSAIEFAGSGRSTESYLVRNIGSGGLVVTNVFVEPREGFPAYVDPATGVESLEFSVDGACPLPCTLSSNNNNYTSLQVTYDPKDEGVDKATLVVEGATVAGEPLSSLRVELTSEVTPLILEVGPSPLTFEHRPSATVTKTLSFRNAALRPINVLDVALEGSEAFSIPGSEQRSFQIVGGDSKTLTVVYQAPSEPQRATLVVRTNAENAEGGTLRVPLVADGAGGLSLLSASEGTLSFNGVAAGGSSALTLTLSSTGTEAVALGGFSLEGDAEVFSVSGEATGALAPGATRALEVTFTRPAGEAVANTYQATLSVASDSAGGAVLVTLVANP